MPFEHATQVRWIYPRDVQKYSSKPGSPNSCSISVAPQRRSDF